MAAIFCVLDDFLERHDKGLTINRVAQDLRDRLARDINDATAQVFVPPPVRGVGGTSGFSMRLQDRAGLGSEAFSRAAQELIQAANGTPGIINTFTTFSTGTPQIFVDVDRMKAQMLKVPMANVFEAMRVYMGSAYVNDFNMFGRTYRVTAQADSAFRLDPENISRIRVRNADGQMVPMGSLVTFRETTGPDRVPRYNLFPAIEINGQSCGGRELGPGAPDHAGRRRAHAAPRHQLRMDRPVLPGEENRPHGLLHLCALRAVRVPGAGGAV